MNVFADNRVVQEDSDPIDVACDASLDEGAAIIRATFTPGLGSSGTEYFVQVDRHEAVTIIEALANAREDLESVDPEYVDGDVDEASETLKGLEHRFARALAYINA